MSSQRRSRIELGCLQALLGLSLLVHAPNMMLARSNHARAPERAGFSPPDPACADGYNLACWPDGALPLNVASGDLVATASQNLSACCVGSTCNLFDATNCAAQGGYFLTGTSVCQPTTCAEGACCTGSADCADQIPGGDPMDEPSCDLIGGRYLGGADCQAGDPCQFTRIPAGFEVVEVTPGMDALIHSQPSLNDCGEIAVEIRNPDPDGDVYLYDNGDLRHIPSPGERNSQPTVNNSGDMTEWVVNADRTLDDVRLLTSNGVHLLGLGNGGSINDLGWVTWSYCAGTSHCQFDAEVHLYDGERVIRLFGDGASNQDPAINNQGEIAWTRYDFTQPFNWTSTPMLFTAGDVRVLPTSLNTPQLVAIDDIGRVAWGNFDFVEVWQNDQTDVLTAGHAPALSNKNDVAFMFQADFTPWEVWLFRAGEFRRLSPEADYNGSVSNIRPDMNDAGEVAWKWFPSGPSLAPSGTRLMRRIRTGDYDLDRDVDRADFGEFTPCFTGSIPTDHLCQCRFYDIDHDRDVDFDDYQLFLSNYTDTIEDCNGNAVSDFEDILQGAAPDCNANGVPDGCDLTGGTSVDADNSGVPDECECPVLQSVHVNPNYSLFNKKNRYLSFTPRAAYWKPGTALIEPDRKGVRAAIRVTLTTVDGFPSFNGQTRWVGPPQEFLDPAHVTGKMTAAPLQCTPHYQAWDGVDLLHVYGDAVVPNSTYDVQIVAEDCQGSLLNESRFSAPATIPTMPKWGDVIEPFGFNQPNFIDIAGLVSTFQNKTGAPIKPWAQLQPNIPNPASAVSFLDIATCVSAFQGRPYTALFPGPSTCP